MRNSDAFLFFLATSSTEISKLIAELFKLYPGPANLFSFCIFLFHSWYREELRR